MYSGYIITIIALVSGITAAAAQTGNIIVYSSIYLATVTVQYTNNVGATAINIYNGTTRGMHVVALDRDVGNITNSGAFDVLDDISEVDRLFTFINSIPGGKILCFAIRDEATTNLNNRSIFQQLGSQYIDLISYRSFWNFVVVKGGEVIGENYILDPDIYWPPPLTLNVSFQLPISAPYNITALNITSTSITLTWNMPLYYPTVILKYTVNYYPDGNVGSSMEASTTGSIPMLVISGLSGGTLYTFTVRVGTEGGGVSSYSIPFNATTWKEEPDDQNPP